MKTIQKTIFVITNQAHQSISERIIIRAFLTNVLNQFQQTNVDLLGKVVYGHGRRIRCINQ